MFVNELGALPSGKAARITSLSPAIGFLQRVNAPCLSFENTWTHVCVFDPNHPFPTRARRIASNIAKLAELLRQA
jgi:acid phosphatase family membrane protein YuiD